MYTLAGEMHPAISREQMEVVAARATQSWTAPACSEVVFASASNISSRAVAGDGINTIQWIFSAWKDLGVPADAPAATDVQYAKSDAGEWTIVEADIYLNAEHHHWVAEGTPLGGERDLLSVLTHESGHMLGLLHPCEPGGADGAPDCAGHPEMADATMYPLYDVQQASLSPDDVAGVCFLYSAAPCESAGCPAGMTCSAGVCQPMGPCPGPRCMSPTCSVHADCTMGQRCIRGKCYGRGADGDPCTSATECTGGVCERGYCASACTVDAHCAKGLTCSAGDTGGMSTCTGKLPLGAACESADQCLGGECLTGSGDVPICTRSCTGGCPSDWACATVDHKAVCRPFQLTAGGGCSIIPASRQPPPVTVSWTLAMLAIFMARRWRALRRNAAESTTSRAKRVDRLATILASITLAVACGGATSETSPSSSAAGAGGSSQGASGGAQGGASMSTASSGSGSGTTGPGSTGSGTSGGASSGGASSGGASSGGASSTATGGSSTGGSSSGGASGGASVDASSGGSSGKADAGLSDGSSESGCTGECVPGEQTFENDGCTLGLLKRRLCGADCKWEPPTECRAWCAGTPRTSPRDQQEVCVPSGYFIRGDEALVAARPAARVFLSAYYIDVYPVTNARYRPCFLQGVCPGMASATEFAIPTKVVEGATRADAVAFCKWDGGRLLPTEAQWEKAARGPVPRNNKYLWGDTAQCDPTMFKGCPPAPGSQPDTIFHSEPAGFYGTGPMGAFIHEMTNDFYDPGYYATPESLRDPTGPASGPYHTVRGYGIERVMAHVRISSRSSEQFNTAQVFRCARPTTDVQ